ncbi:PAS domain-containing sensor histidine kinase [Mucilaginibacter daejeonensis]|uniref:PAS domain-containing sensor histidine kinase n=1 Tax=Mucilaginibacter daejeonensis TaxID=398049 RepID=UPI001D17B553|nr:PAS domain-containing sensor histidine kinase [Mucilaginibacter daejeonensis]UEG55258.1 PAS domain-containing sensor histidine kinase [Mucilaginibacter daejeonensis]
MLPETEHTDLYGGFYQANAALMQLFGHTDGIAAVVRGANGVCVWMSPLFSRLFKGHDALELPMRQAWPQLGEGTFRNIEAAYHSGRTTRLYELPVHDPDHKDRSSRSTKFYDLYFSPLLDRDGAITGVTISGFDVTDRVLIRSHTIEQQLLFKDITDAAGTALWTVDQRGNMTFVNHTWVQWTGHPYEDHMGRGWIEYVMPEDRDRVISTFIRELTVKNTFQLDFRVVRADGGVQWVAATGKPRYLSSGEFAGYVGSCMDITERKSYERSLQESERRFRDIADSAPVLIWMTGANKRITFLNKNWTSFASVPHLLADNGYLQSDLMHPLDHDMVLNTYEEAFENRQEFYMEYRMRHSDGDYRWIGMKGIPRFTDDNVFEGYIGSGMDITEMKEHEQVKNDFIGMASHELKTPITSIKAYVQLLLTIYAKREHDEFLMRSLSTVNKQINKLTRLITDLLDVSKMESGRLSLNSEVFTLHDLIKETVDEVQHTSSQHDIIYSGLPPTISIYADRDRIAQVVTNFLTNAIKYSPESDRVDVDVEISEREVTVIVRDYGIGIDTTEQAKIFDRFYRVEGRNEQTFSGFGIGLYVVAEIVKRHNGRVWVLSEKNKGAAFHFTLPISTDQA